MIIIIMVIKLHNSIGKLQLIFTKTQKSQGIDEAGILVQVF